MKILPPATSPWEELIDRRHHPPAVDGRRGYQEFRQCLRWEFGFTCAFCLCHEADLSLHGIEGTGISGIEHFEAVSQSPSQVNEYHNCFYACRFCNLDRHAQALIDPSTEGRLLNPCEAVWGNRFSLVDDELKPSNAGPDATYTHDTYNLNHPRKVEMRRFRRETITEWLSLLEEGPSYYERWMDRAAATGDASLIVEAEMLARLIRKAYRDLERFQVIPKDARLSCSCKDPILCTIPQALDTQTREQDLPLI